MNKILMGLLASLPLMSWSGYFSPFEVPKTWMVIVLSGLSVILAIFHSQPTEKTKYHGWLLAMVVMLWGWLLVSSVMAGEFWQSWLGNPYRADGLLTLLSMMALGLTMGINANVGRWVASVNLLLSAWVLINGRPDAALTMGNPNMLAGYLAVTLPCFLFLPTRYQWAILLPILAIGLIGSWGGILVASLFMLSKILHRYPRLLASVLILAIVAVLLLYQRDYQKKALPGYIVAESRGRILTKALIAIRQKPLTGWGWAQFSKAFAQIDYPEHFLLDAHVDRTHSSILEMGVAGGIGGLILYGAIAGMTTMILLKSKAQSERILGLMVILYLIHSQTNITSVAEDWLFWAGVGRAIKIG